MPLPPDLQEFIQNPIQVPTAAKAMLNLMKAAGHSGLSLTELELRTHLEQASQKNLNWDQSTSANNINSVFNYTFISYPKLKRSFDYMLFWKPNKLYDRGNYRRIAFWQKPINPDGFGGSVLTGDYSPDSRLPLFVSLREGNAPEDYIRISLIKSILLTELVQNSRTSEGLTLDSLFEAVYRRPYQKSDRNLRKGLSVTLCHLKTELASPEALYEIESKKWRHFWAKKKV
jgi:hypothetical protein